MTVVHLASTGMHDSAVWRQRLDDLRAHRPMLESNRLAALEARDAMRTAAARRRALALAFGIALATASIGAMAYAGVPEWVLVVATCLAGTVLAGLWCVSLLTSGHEGEDASLDTPPSNEDWARVSRFMAEVPAVRIIVRQWTDVGPLRQREVAMLLTARNLQIAQRANAQIFEGVEFESIARP